MNFYRETIRNAPPMIQVPVEFQNHDFEVIFLQLDEKENGETIETDANGYPIGFFERTAGSLPDFPEREPQPPYDIREEIE